MVARLLAMIGALGMIFGAYVFRYGMPGGDGDGADGPGGGSGGEAAIVCAAELGTAVCDTIVGATVEPAAETAARLIGAPSARAAGVGGWVVPGTWPVMVDEARALKSRSELFAGGRTSLASTPLVAVSRKGQLPPACAPLTWRCLGDAAQDPNFRIGADPRTNAFGLFVRSSAIVGYLGNDEFGINDLRDDPAADTWYANLEQRLAAAPNFGARDLQSFVLQQGSARVYLTTGAAARDLRRNAGFDVGVPAETTVIAAGYWKPDGGRDLDTRNVAGALVDDGWERVQPAFVGTGLPSPGVLLALSEVG